MVGMKPVDSGVVIGSLVDELTHTQESILLLDHTFILVSWARHYY